MHVKTLLLKTSQKEGRISDKRNVSSSRLHSDLEELSSEANELERLVFWVRTTVYSPDMFQSLKACTLVQLEKKPVSSSAFPVADNF